MAEILDERLRQIAEEGYTAERDDNAYCRAPGNLATAAGVYAAVSGTMLTNDVELPDCFKPKNWPWELRWFKRSTPRRMLVKAAALIVAQIELIDRREAAAPR